MRIHQNRLIFFTISFIMTAVACKLNGDQFPLVVGGFKGNTEFLTLRIDYSNRQIIAAGSSSSADLTSNGQVKTSIVFGYSYSNNQLNWFTSY